MHLIVVDDDAALSRVGANEVAALIATRSAATLLVATGNTPMGLYADLARRHQRDELDTSQLRVVQLDEYLGIGEGDRRSLYGWMMRSFVVPLGVPATNVVRLPGHLIGAAPIRGITGNALGSQVDGPSRRVRFRRRLVEPEVPVGAEDG